MRRIPDNPHLPLRDPAVLGQLLDLRIRIVCPREDPLWHAMDLGEAVQRAYRAVEKHDVIIPPLSPLYFPQYVEDWEDHRELLRALSIYVLTKGTRGTALRPLRLNQGFFILGNETLIKLLTGRCTERDILVMLERRRESSKRTG